MKFGGFWLLQSPGVRPTQEVYGNALEQMVLADELGYDSVWLAEHHFSNYGYCPNPLPLAIKVAQVTKKVRIGTAVLVLPIWHPLRLAEDIALTDLLTEGRLEVGFGRGYQKYEFDRIGLDIQESRERSEETLDIVIKAFTSDSFTHEGHYYQIPETAIYPKPIQKPHPPFWIAATTPESIQSTVRRGLNLFTTGSTRPLSIVENTWGVFQDTLKAEGKDSHAEFAVQQQVFVADTDEEARREMENPLWHFRMVTRLRGATERVEKGVAYVDPVEGEPSLDELFESRTITGSPKTVIEKLQRYVDAVGMTHLNCVMALGAIENEKVKHSLRLFAEHVMPHFK